MKYYNNKGLFPEKRVFDEIITISIDDTVVYKSYVDSQWISEGKQLKNYSPINNELLSYLLYPTEDTLSKGVETLYVKGKWSIRNTPGEERLEMLQNTASLLEEYKNEFIDALVYDAGKTVSAAKGEVNASIERLRKAPLDLKKISGEYLPGDWSHQTLESEGIVRREPYGIVTGITPFNYPLYDTVMKIVSSVLPGNAVLLKPSNKDPIAPLMFVKLLLEAGFPEDSIAITLTPGREFEKILPDRRIHAILLTGSTTTGKRVLSIAGIKSYLLELGGGDPAIVLRDADLETAAEKIIKGVISYSGQRCDAIKLILVEAEVYDKVKELLIKELEKQVIVGDPRDEKTTVGPLIDSMSVDRMIEAINQAITKGAKLLWGGERIGSTYITPCLLEADKEILNDLELYNEEVFAPVALLVRIESLDEAIEISNNRRYGLDAAIFSKNVEWIRKAIRYLEVGAIYVNDYPRHGIGYYPYGGRKDSGIGIEGIGYSIDYVTSYKTIVYNYKGAKIWEYMI